MIKPETLTCECGYPRAVGYACTACTRYDHLPPYDRVTAEVRASQRAYAARPYAVRWRDSHFSGTFRFHTFDEAFEYVQSQWLRICEDVANNRCRASALWSSYIETPEWKISLSYLLLTADVSSYGFSDLPQPQKSPQLSVSTKPQIHAFNTRRGYTAHGQRIAWAVLSTGRVAMVDIDRHIDYTLHVSGTPSNQTVLAAYDANNTVRWDETENREVRALRDLLYSAARGAPSLTSK